MKVLMLTPYLPYPLLSGGQIRTYNLLKKLKNKHQITLFSFIREKKEKIYLSQLSKFCYKIKVFHRRPAWSWKNILLALFTPFPFVMVSTYLSREVRRAIKNELKTNKYDLIHAEPFYMAPNIPKTNIPILLVEQTIEYLVYKKYVDDFPLIFLKLFLYFDVLKLKFWEEYYWRRATFLVAMSQEDKKIMAKVVPKQRIDIVANGVDISYFAQTRIKRPKKPTILFVGNFKWLPNKDAAKFLTYDIWPLIKEKIPDAKLWIVGKNPTWEIKKLGEKKDVFVDDKVKDIRQAFGRASVLVAPIRNGRGTKYKVLEAMASKLPVVTTPLGIEGLTLKKKNEVIVAEDARDLAEKTIELLNNPYKGKKISKAAYSLVRQLYNWPRISRKLDRIYRYLGKKN